MEDETEISRLKAKIGELEQKLAQALAQLETAQKRLLELEALKTPPPAWLKANRPKDPATPKKARRKRLPSQNKARRLELKPSNIVENKPSLCPTCHQRLGGLRLSRKRQVIELPEPTAPVVTEYQLYQGWCSNCHKWHEAALDLSGQVLGQGRIGHGIVSLIGYLRETLRLPVGLIQAYLLELHTLKLSAGEIVEVLHRLAQHFKPHYLALKKQGQASPIKYVDETLWREDGQNGYVWSLTSQDQAPARYYEYQPSREGWVARSLIGHPAVGASVSDFYSGYNEVGGIQQRCWTHLLRDLHKLKETHPKNEAVLEWAGQVKGLYQSGQALVGRGETGPPTQAEREKLYKELWEAVGQLGRQYAQQPEHPCKTLAKRLLRHRDELFQFVLVPGLAADNNTAERSVRPIAVERKISGGSRSAKGSQTRMILRSLFGTWQLRGQNPRQECLALLRQPNLATT